HPAIRAGPGLLGPFPAARGTRPVRALRPVVIRVVVRAGITVIVVTRVIPVSGTVAVAIADAAVPAAGIAVADRAVGRAIAIAMAVGTRPAVVIVAAAAAVGVVAHAAGEQCARGDGDQQFADHGLAPVLVPGQHPPGALNPCLTLPARGAGLL